MDSVKCSSCVAWSGNKIAYKSYGSGSIALVWIHGWTMSIDAWYAQYPLIEKAPFRSILVDWPGHGQSDAPEGVEYTVEVLAGAIIHLLVEELKLEKVILIGHSMGGLLGTTIVRQTTSIDESSEQLVWDLSVSSPLQVLGIIYIDSFFILPEHLAPTSRRQAARARFSGDGFRDILSMFLPPSTAPEIKKKVVDISLSTPEHVRLSCVTTDLLPPHWRPSEVYADIEAIQIYATPLAIVRDDWKRHFPRLEQDAWTGEQDAGKYGHFLHMDDPDRMNKKIEEWLKEKEFWQA